MQEEKKKRLLSYGNAVLVCVSVMLIMYTNAVASSLLVNISQDLGTDLAITGYLPTVTTLFMGLSLLAATAAIERFGLRLTMAGAMFLVTAGNLSVFWADSFWVLLLGRALVGIGMGTMGDGFSMVAATWAGAKGRSVFVTVYTLGNTLGSYLCFITAIPLYAALGNSWRMCYLLLGIGAAVLCGAWILLGREPERAEEPEKSEEKLRRAEGQRGSEEPQQKKGPLGDGLRRVLVSKDVWILTIYHSLAIMCTNLITNYLPAYLQVVRGYSPEQASAWTGILSLTGMIGTVVGGSLSTALGKRLPVVISGTALSLFSMIGLLVLRQPLAIFVSIAVFGFAVRYRIPATTSISTEMRENDAAFSSAAYALMYGVGSVLGVVAPPILSLATKSFGMARGMLLFVMLLAIATIVSVFVKETGPGRAK